ncbi:MAG: L,D-transpeptidase family protein [Pseudomonadales bacterium]|nr:L,D-transpeptidase family protein [Halioglobus sp.]MCP5131288.1 L,D-transpeptidase family protein [Pseudomonadales bacterium]
MARLLCLGCLVLFAGRGLGASEPLQGLMQQLATDGQLDIAGATVYNLPVTQEFYRRKDWSLAWTRPESVTELAAVIDQAEREGMNGWDYHRDQVRGLLDGSLDLEPSQRDLLLSDSLVRLTYHYALGKLDPVDFSSSWNFDRQLPQVDPVTWMENVTGNGGIGAGIDKLKPAGPAYQNMVAALAKYRQLESDGGWGRVDEGPTLRPGDSGPRVEQLRRRLQAEGNQEVAQASDPQYFDAGLEQAIKRFQEQYRLDADGIVGRQTIAAMNVPIARRIGQIRVNLERARVLRGAPPTAVIVDIAGFEVSLWRDGQQLFEGRAQVGRPYRSTPVFSDTITYIEFNPTWTVPPTIFRKDVLPAIKRDPDYLRKRDMQVLTMGGVEIDPATVNWDRYPREGFPYMIRQRPGPDNALGRLKIMFPNEHMVYLHDTPSRALFNRSERTFSSGCIRVENAEALAELLLDDPGQWDLAAINAVIASQKTRRVSLREPVPIYLVYWTVQALPGGEVQFKRDPYDRDAVILEALDLPLVPDAGRLKRAVGNS